jgi:hypothetical protein
MAGKSYSRAAMFLFILDSSFAPTAAEKQTDRAENQAKV